MTEFQKKKYIDLGLIVIGVILVGSFLKTQLSNPIILNIESEIDTNIDKNYLTGNYFDDEENLENQEVADLKSVSVTMDLDYIDVILELRSIPEKIFLDTNRYEWNVYFDVNNDDDESEDIIIRHSNVYLENQAIDYAALSDDIFVTSIIRLSKGNEEVLGYGQSGVEGNFLLLRIPNSKKLQVNEETPFKVVIRHQIDQTKQSDEKP